MRTIVASLAVIMCLAGCGDDGDGKDGGKLSGPGCLTVDDQGRPVQCISYSGSGVQFMPGGAAGFCPDDLENMKRVEGCPLDATLVGRCETDLGADMKQTVFYYLPEGDVEDAAVLFEGMCLSGEWTLHE